MRTPATAPIPVVREPSWDQLTRRKRRPGRAPTRRVDVVAWWAEKVALAVGWGGMLGLVIELTYSGPVV